MRKKIKKIIFFLLIAILLTGGFLAFKEYRGVKANRQYDSCAIECNKNYDDNRGNLELNEEGEIDKSLLPDLKIRYESCLNVCVTDYEKITGKEITPLYEILKEEWQLDATP